MAATSASRSWSSLVAKGLATSAVAAVALIALAVPASAHKPEAKSDCAKNGEATLHIKLTNYPAKENTVTVLEGDKTVFDTTQFKGDWEKTLKFDGTVAHNWVVSIKAGDDPDGKQGWTKDIRVKSDVCEQPPSSEPSEPSEPSNPPSSEAPPSSAPVTPTTTTPPAVGANANLAETGASIALPLGIGALLLLGGGALLLVMRKRGKA
jgi:hypothetical protein